MRRNELNVRRSCRLELLELRLTRDSSASASAALPWFDLQNLSYSFVPDGTALGAERSSLFASLSATGDQNEWKDAFARAFEAWLVELNVQATERPDSGDPFGTLAATQGSERFGDVRIGAIPLASNTMAEAVPHAMITQGSWAGDIILNSNAEWTNLQQVYAVALHEFGHVLGLGHSEDRESPMFFHGVHNAAGPTPADIAQLEQLYAGLQLNAGDDGFEPHDDHGEVTDWRDEPEFAFDPALAIDLTATIATAARYEGSGELTELAPTGLFRLLPIGEVDHAQFLNIVISATEIFGLKPAVQVFDESGDPLPFEVLHNTEGTVIVQVRDVEPNQTYFLGVTAAAADVQFQIGGYRLFAEWGTVALLPTKVGEYSLSADQPIVEQVLSTDTSRLVHILLRTESGEHRRSAAAIWGTLVDSVGTVLARFALNHGESRSTPLLFLPQGDFRLYIQTGTNDGSEAVSAVVQVFVDEVTLRVGPGVVDPSIQPDVSCSSPGANTSSCVNPAPIIAVGLPVYPQPNAVPAVAVVPPWNSKSWFYWSPVSLVPLHNSLLREDVSGDSLVSALDILLVVNALNSPVRTASRHYLDVSGDQQISPLDILLVVNYLNRQLAGGEGEPADLGRSLARDVPHVSLEADLQLRADQAFAQWMDVDFLRKR